ncbi:hypothetical protein EDC18_10588 [Natranaerovirga pectinivora]|uniref:site-specific DNA-methyltransferase (adenine-specific) n=1 Tax=Natranaerovirga pectinivora TaxID=682400 RepID=A0A4R3MLP3_9FIRM|nr:type I restriction-modification system subunit M [Natranaerovirga pectinivora]TCT14607.1 hypothetical protein EDC18_10588 [Natranaerovirga pectinivora]
MIKNEENIKERINTPEFSKLCQKITNEILEACLKSNSEADVVDAFNRCLYHHLRNFFGLSDGDISPKSEVGRTDEGIINSFEGRMDTVYNNYYFFIEFKKYDALSSTTILKKAIKQTVSYFNQEKNKFSCAVLCDGKNIMYFNKKEDGINHSVLKVLDFNDIKKISQLILLNSQKQFTTENILIDFALTKSKENASNKLAKKLYNVLTETSNKKTDMILKQWENAFHLSEADSGQSNDIAKRRRALGEILDCNISNNSNEYRALFALQTTYATNIKMIAFKFISKLVIKENSFYFDNITDVDENTLKNKLQQLQSDSTLANINGLLDDIFFSWYYEDEVWDYELYEILKEVITVVDEYEYIGFVYSSSPDLFRRLYMETIPNEVRHSLGEYFTPEWLAEKTIIDAVGDDDFYKIVDKLILDPCCGSAVFLTSYINNVINNFLNIDRNYNERMQLLEKLLNNVKGIDLNPLSVLMARVSYLIAISRLFDGGEEILLPTNIPVYLGDASAPVMKVNVDGIECLQSQVFIENGETITAVFPIDVINKPDFLENMGILDRVLEDINVVSEFNSIVVNKIPDLFGNKELANVTYCLTERLVELKNNGRSFGALRLIANSLQISSIERCDYIVGNPPWVKWEHLPEYYAKNIKTRCLEQHLFSGQSYMGAISLNICALIANDSAKKWLKEDGKLSFLMPKTMLTQDSYEGFREFYLDFNTGKRLYLEQVVDYEKAGHPFIQTQESFCEFLYTSKPVDYKNDGVPVTIVKKKKGKNIELINMNSHYNTVKEDFEYNELLLVRADENRTGFSLVNSEEFSRDELQLIIGECAYKARSGVEFTPLEVFMLEIDREKTTEDNLFVKSVPRRTSKYKSLVNGKSFQIEERYIRPLITGPNIQKFYIKETNEVCIFPYQDNDRYAVDVSEMVKCNNTYNYLRNHKHIIGSQSKRSQLISMGKAFYSLSKVGLYTFNNCMVTFRDNTKMNAAVVTPEKFLNKKDVQGICAKHAPYISRDKEGNFITINEADYICAILNTPIIEYYFKATYSNRSYSIRFNIKIPKYDELNKSHRKLSELGKLARQKNGKNTEDLINEMQNIYLKLCKEIDTVIK